MHSFYVKNVIYNVRMHPHEPTALEVDITAPHARRHSYTVINYCGERGAVPNSTLFSMEAKLIEAMFRYVANHGKGRVTLVPIAYDTQGSKEQFDLKLEGTLVKDVAFWALHGTQWQEIIIPFDKHVNDTPDQLLALYRG